MRDRTATGLTSSITCEYFAFSDEKDASFLLIPITYSSLVYNLLNSSQPRSNCSSCASLSLSSYSYLLPEFVNLILHTLPPFFWSREITGTIERLSCIQRRRGREWSSSSKWNRHSSKLTRRRWYTSTERNRFYSRLARRRWYTSTEWNGHNSRLARRWWHSSTKWNRHHAG